MATEGGDNHYLLLGVSPLASFDEVKEAYRKQALICHPDKNRNEDATERFQRLGEAWETLRDPYRRREYDLQILTYWRTNTVKDLRPQRQSTQYEHRAESLVRIEKGKAFLNSIQSAYTERLHNWEDYFRRQWVSIKHYQVLVRRYEKQMEEQVRETHESMLQKFNAAISLSEAKGTQIGDHEAVIAKLMDARRIYLLNLKLAGQATRGRLQYLLEELAEATRSFEQAEYQNRQMYVREGLAVLEIERSYTPLFTIIDRRQQSINHWRALGRVESSISSPLLECMGRIWHQEGSWPRVAGEHSCARCKKSAFHIIPGMGAASCPGCGVIVCASCHHDLKILRDFDNWLREEGNNGMSLFSLDFEGGSEPVSRADFTA